MSYAGRGCPLRRGDSLRSMLFRMPNIQGGANGPGFGFFCVVTRLCERSAAIQRVVFLDCFVPRNDDSRGFCLSVCLLSPFEGDVFTPPCPPLSGGGAKRGNPLQQFFLDCFVPRNDAKRT